MPSDSAAGVAPNSRWGGPWAEVTGAGRSSQATNWEAP